MLQADIKDHKELISYLMKLGFKIDYYQDRLPDEDLYIYDNMEVYVNIEDNSVKLFSYKEKGTILIFEGVINIIEYLKIEFKYELRKHTIKKYLND